LTHPRNMLSIMRCNFVESDAHIIEIHR